MDRGEPFSYWVTKDGRVRIDWKGRTVTVLRGAGAKRLLARLDGADPETVQLVLAKATGNFKHGNERPAG